MNNKNYVNEMHKPINLIGKDVYNELIIARNENVSKRRKNQVSAKSLSTGKNMVVSREEFDKNEDLVGMTIGMPSPHLKNTVSVIGENGKTIRIPSSDFNPKIHKGHTIGRSPYRHDGKIIMLGKDDERRKLPDYISVTAGIKRTPEQRLAQSIQRTGVKRGKYKPQKKTKCSICGYISSVWTRHEENCLNKRRKENNEENPRD